MLKMSIPLIFLKYGRICAKPIKKSLGLSSRASFKPIKLWKKIQKYISITLMLLNVSHHTHSDDVNGNACLDHLFVGMSSHKLWKKTEINLFHFRYY